MLKITIHDTGKQNAYLLDNGETTLQIDLGVPVKSLETMADFAIYSHQHKDHYINSKTYRKKTTVLDFNKKNEANRLGSYYVQSVSMRHGKEWVNGFVILDLRHNEIYIFAIDFSEYRELATVANLFSNAYQADITVIMCELHHSENIIKTKPEEVFWASRRHCSDELFKGFISNFPECKKRKIIALHTNNSLFDFFNFRPHYKVDFAKKGKTFII